MEFNKAVMNFKSNFRKQYSFKFLKKKFEISDAFIKCLVDLIWNVEVRISHLNWRISYYNFVEAIFLI